MKRFFSFVLVLICLFSAGNAAFADKCTAYNWYCTNNNDHTLPKLGRDLAIITKYDGYYANCNVKGGDKVIYLTFDAGYENGNVAKILDALKAHNATGAFFILGNLIKRNGELVMRMVNEGHMVCNHTRSHPDMTEITDKRMFFSQLDSLAKMYFELTGKEMAKVYRPPEGRFSEQNLCFAKELGYKTVFWSFAYADWDNNKQMSEEKALEKILAHIHNGEVMLLHPTSATNAAILDRLLTKLEDDGYRFGSLEELWK